MDDSKGVEMRRRFLFIGLFVGVATLAIAGLTTASAATPESPKSCADAPKIKIKHCSSFVLLDTMPGDIVYTGALTGTSTADNGASVDNDVAAGFQLGTQNVLLQSLTLPLGFLFGINQADVYLVQEKQRATTNGGAAYAPDDSAVLEHWYLDSVGPGPEIEQLQSVLNPKLLAGSRYWVYLDAHVAVSYIGWYGAVSGYTGSNWKAERNVAYPDWLTLSFSGPGLGLRITALH
jgi:hypothetical protein